jgi:hypothetical protein
VSVITWGYVTVDRPGVPLVGYTEFARDTATNDILVPVRLLRGPDAVIQRVKQRFPFFLGEWFLDKRLGVPYYEQILVKNPDVSVVTAIFRRVLEETPGVSRVVSMTARLDRAARELVTSFEALLEDPTVIVRAVDAPFKVR